MANKNSIKRNSEKIKRSVVDKVLFILSGISTLVVFMVDWFSNVLTLELKWQVILGLITVLSGFFTIISFCFDKKFSTLEKRTNEAEKSILNMQNESANKAREEIGRGLSSLHDLYSYQTLDNEDFKEYAQKKVDALIQCLNRLFINGESDVLDETDYYEKLNQLADRIEDDQLQYGMLDETDINNHVKPIIWALTCFNEDEWGEEIKVEDDWSDRLERLTAVHGIDVERICILSDDIQKFIKIDDVSELNEILVNNKHLKSFMGFLLRYYKSDVIDKYRKSTIHYAFFANDSSKLAQTKGFFGICLSNGEKHIVKGDCVVGKNESTAKIVFNCDDLYSEFEIKKQHRMRLENYISSTASVAFKAFLKSKNIHIH